MPVKPLRFCAHSGCKNLTDKRFCDEHAADEQIKSIDHRGSAQERGYDNNWRKFSKWFLSLPENQFCKLHISSRCNGLAECVDHIHPLQGPNDPRKYDLGNVQASCLACNTLKGGKVIIGTWEYGEGNT